MTLVIAGIVTLLVVFVVATIVSRKFREAVIAFLANLPLGSDMGLKQNVERIDHALPLIRQLQLVRFEYKDQAVDDTQPAAPRYGFIAQELKEVLPEAVMRGSNGYLEIDYSCLVALLARSVVELDAEVRSLKQRQGETNDAHS